MTNVADANPLSPSYTQNDRGYPVYNRFTEEDQHIVPSVLKMIRKYNCHIKTEICHDVFIIEYLFKYIYKGRPHVKVECEDFVEKSVDKRIGDQVNIETF